MKYQIRNGTSRTALIFCFHLKKTVAESYRLFGEAYGEHVPSQKTYEQWFQRFKIGDFDVADKQKRPKSTKLWNCKHCWMMERRKNTCEILLERYKRKSFLHRTVTGDEKWIFFENPKRKKSWIEPRRTIHIDRKTESLWQEDDVLCLVGSEGCDLL